MTRNTALRCAAWLAVLARGPAAWRRDFRRGSRRADRHRGVHAGRRRRLASWRPRRHLAGHPQAETYTMLFTIAILIGLAFLVGKIFVALWGKQPAPAQAETPALSLAPSLADLEQYRRERDKSRGERR